jgi:hypothetical protein
MSESQIVMAAEHLPYFNRQIRGFPGRIRRFPAVVKANPKTISVGHADAFRANVSTDVPDGIPCPDGKIKPGRVSERLLSEYANFYADLSAYSCPRDFRSGAAGN